MRIKVDINNPNDAQNMAALQTWIEGHADGQSNFFVAVNLLHDNNSIVFRFEYNWMLGCHRLFILDPIDDELLSFYVDDFTDTGKWIFKRCDEYFGGDYDILA